MSKILYLSLLDCKTIVSSSNSSNKSSFLCFIITTLSPSFISLTTYTEGLGSFLSNII